MQQEVAERDYISINQSISSLFECTVPIGTRTHHGPM